MPKWLKWLIFCLSGIFTFTIGQALVDFNVLSNKWWLITLVMAGLYWFLFARTPKVKVEQTVKYDWGKKK